MLKVSYLAFGLILNSDIVFDALAPLKEKTLNPKPDITIESGSVSQAGLPSPNIRGLFYQYTDTDCWVHIPNLAYFLMHDGKAITYCPYPSINPDTIHTFILSLCLPIIFLQKKRAVISATTIKHDNGCFAIAGPSGAGKSTLAAAFLKRGYQILSDDISVLSEKNKVTPGFPFLTLWQHSLNKLEMNQKTLKPIRPLLKKYIYPLGSSFFSEPLPLMGIYLLNDMNQESHSFTQVKGVKKLNTLNKLLYAEAYTHTDKIRAAIKLRLFNLSQSTPLHIITRPTESFDMTPTIDYIEETLSSTVTT